MSISAITSVTSALPSRIAERAASPFVNLSSVIPQPFGTGATGSVTSLLSAQNSFLASLLGSAGQGNAFPLLATANSTTAAGLFDQGLAATNTFYQTAFAAGASSSSIGQLAAAAAHASAGYLLAAALTP